MAMFPPSMPHVFIRWLTECGDVVYDPFAGRGTAPAEASLMGRVGVGSDLNPLAHVLTGAKVDPPSRRSLDARLRQLADEVEVLPIDDVPAIVRPLFDQHTLGQLLWLREKLNVGNRTDRFLMAVLLGNLHLNALTDGTPRGLTAAMPNTFAMAPRYVAKYITDNQLVKPRVEVLPFLAQRTGEIQLPGEGFQRGAAWIQDATLPVKWPVKFEAPKLIFSSPPYLQVIQYGKFNWIRLWLLGVDGWELDQDLFTSASLKLYLDFMQAVMRHTMATLRTDGFACFVIGDVRKGENQINLAREVQQACVPDEFRLIGLPADRIPSGHKVSRIWKSGRGRATKTDRLIILAGPDAVVPPLGRISWNESC